MTIVEKLLKSSVGINALKKIATIISGIIFLILMTRFLGPSLRGEYAYIMNLVNIIVTIFNLGISLVLPNYLKEKKEFGLNDFVLLSLYQFIFNIIISLIIFLTIGNIEYTIILILSSISILALQVNNITLVSNIRLNAFCFIASSVINVLLIVTVYLFFSQHIYWIISIYIIKEVVIIVLGLYLTPFKFFYFNPRWLLIIKKGILPMLTTALIAINYRIDTIMLEFYNIDFALIGLFATGVSLAEYSWLIPDIFKEVMLNKNTKKDEVDLLSLSLRFAFSSVIVCAILFLLFGKHVLLILFGIDYVDSYFVTVSMFFAVPFMIYVKIIGVLFITQNRWVLYSFILTITVILNILINIFLIPSFNIYGAALASITSYAFCGLSCIYWYSRKYSIPFFSLFFINKKDIQYLMLYIK